ncbi:T9SS type A sorting domain-containing protein [Fulvitalea axinellae]
MRTFIIGVFSALVFITAQAQDPATEYGGYGRVFFKGKHWIFGGSQNFTENNYIWSSPDGKTWTKEGSGPWGARASVGCLVFRDRIYLIGGGKSGASSKGLNDIWVSDNGTSWKKQRKILQSSSYGLYSPKVIIFKGKLMILNGQKQLLSYAEEHFNGTVTYTEDGENWKEKNWEHDSWHDNVDGGIFEYNGKLWRMVADPYFGYRLSEHNKKWGLYFSEDGLDWTKYGNDVDEGFFSMFDGKFRIENGEAVRYRDWGNPNSQYEERFKESELKFRAIADTLIHTKEPETFERTVVIRYPGAFDQGNVSVSVKGEETCQATVSEVTSVNGEYAITLECTPTGRFGRADITVTYKDSGLEESQTFAVVANDNLNIAPFRAVHKIWKSFPRYLFVTAATKEALAKGEYTLTAKVYNRKMELLGEQSGNVKDDNTHMFTLAISTFGEDSYKIIHMNLSQGDENYSYYQYTLTDDENVPPFFETQPKATAIKGNEEFRYAVVAFDANGKFPDLEVKQKPDWLEFENDDDGTGTLKGSTPTTGEYGVVLVATDGENETEQRFVIKVDGQAPVTENVLDIEMDNKLKVYPNPSYGQINFKAEKGKPIKAIKLYSNDGRLVADRELVAGEGIVNLSGLSPGVYTVWVFTERDTVKRKIVVRR